MSFCVDPLELLLSGLSGIRIEQKTHPPERLLVVGGDVSCFPEDAGAELTAGLEFVFLTPVLLS